MTQNPGPRAGSYGTPSTAEQPPLNEMPVSEPAAYEPAPASVQYGVTPATPTHDDASKTEAAKGEAAEVKKQAAEAAQGVAETAKAEAATVAAEVKTNAKDLLHQAKSDLTDQAGAQQQKVAEGLRSISTELHSMASASDQPGVATDLVRQAAERSSAVAGWLDGRDPGSLLDEVKSFARQRPGTFLLLAAGAGVLAGRLSRSLSAGAPDATGADSAQTPARVTRIPDTGLAVPPPPVQMPAPEATTAGFADTYPPNPLDADAGQGEFGRQDRWAAEPAGTEPRRQDPARNDPFDGGPR